MNTPSPTFVSTRETLQRSRSVENLVRGKDTMDGAGVKLTRVLTHDLQHRLDPYLLLDAFRSDSPDDYIGGFPDHPHRGFETISYMISGRMRHHDSAGNEGLLQNGDVQWMITGSGLVHSELPEQENGLLEGFQLWLNLPAKDKMIAPSYRDIPAATIPQITTPDQVDVRIIAGASHGVAGAVTRPTTEPLYLDIHLPAGVAADFLVPAGHNAFLYTYRGTVEVGGVEVPDRTMAILANDPTSDGVRIQARVASRVLLVAGKPLDEPIVQHGPFVMNTAEEIRATVQDYQSGQFGTIKARKEA